jgi:ubiquinone/menaquinone biosynthesis C-methylase UbiE
LPFPPAAASRRPDDSPSPDGATLVTRINERYDVVMYSDIAEEYYDRSGFQNFGCWTPRTRSQREASENLVDRLIDSFFQKSGTILDVACGLGASTRRLLRHYKPSAITAINISDKQLATCRQKAPGCHFLNMNAAELKFPDDSFDNILCVEAVFHFDTRERFLREAYRVLRPGGCLALSDILFRSPFVTSLGNRIPVANHVPDLRRYQEPYTRCGFEDVRVVEARAYCWERFRDESLAFVRAKVLVGRLPWGALRQVETGLRRWDWAIGHYLLVSARKPHRPADGRRSRRRRSREGPRL